MQIFKEPVQFEWDEGNRHKNVRKHRVTNEECEEVFFDPHKRMVGQPVYHIGEARYLLIGRTRQQRLLFVVCTVRRSAVRVISARDLNHKERHLYEQAIKDSAFS